MRPLRSAEQIRFPNPPPLFQDAGQRRPSKKIYLFKSQTKKRRGGGNVSSLFSFHVLVLIALNRGGEKKMEETDLFSRFCPLEFSVPLFHTLNAPFSRHSALTLSIPLRPLFRTCSSLCDENLCGKSRTPAGKSGSGHTVVVPALTHAASENNFYCRRTKKKTRRKKDERNINIYFFEAAKETFMFVNQPLLCGVQYGAIEEGKR